jgi:hypothetical protein
MHLYVCVCVGGAGEVIDALCVRTLTRSLPLSYTRTHTWFSLTRSLTHTLTLSLSLSLSLTYLLFQLASRSVRRQVTPAFLLQLDVNDGKGLLTQEHP